MTIRAWTPQSSTSGIGNRFASSWFGAVPVAYLAQGTRILTTRGQVPVQALRPDEDEIITRCDRLAPLRWRIGSRALNPAQHNDPAAVCPAYARTHAFSPFSPARDLSLPPAHALFVDGAFIPVHYLIRGATVAQGGLEGKAHLLPRRTRLP
jgi:antigen 43